MTYGILGSVAPELLVPHWIDENGQARPPVTLKELGARHRVLFFYQSGIAADAPVLMKICPALSVRCPTRTSLGATKRA